MSDINQKGSLVKDDNGVSIGWQSKNITAAAPTTTTIKATPGILHSITFNKPAATGVVTVYDGTATGTVLATITTPANPMPVTLFYDLEFNSLLTIVTATAAQDITVSYI